MASSRGTIPSMDKFAEVLSQESEWYTVGAFLDSSAQDLDFIASNYSKAGIMRCYIEVYKCLKTRGKCLTWEHIATSLRRMKNHNLAELIHSEYIKLMASSQDVSADSTLTSNSTKPGSSEPTEEMRPQSIPIDGTIVIKNSPVDEIAKEYENLSEKFISLVDKVKVFFQASNVNIEDLQEKIEVKSGLLPITEQQATFRAVFKRIKHDCSILDTRILIFIVSDMLENGVLQRELKDFQKSVNTFNSSANIIQLVCLIGNKQDVTDKHKVVKLKVREFWKHLTMQKFEQVARKILYTLYEIMSQIRVTRGCICISWVIPDIDTTKLVPDHSLDLIRIIGVISLHIGSDVIYNNEGEGCETIEAAMLQAIELKNTRAIELLLAMGCNPEVATYNGDNAVTTIVNIRESKKSSVDHVCIIGHNEHVEAIVDPSSKPAECSSCKQLHQQIDTLRQEQTTLHSLTDQLQLTVKAKGILIQSLSILL